MWRTRSWAKNIRLLGASILLLGLTSACGLPRVLSTNLPASQGTISVGKLLSQPFLSPANGLDGVTVAVSPPVGTDGELLPQPTGGATVSVRYAPEADNRFPDGAFHDWPASDQWLGELTGVHKIGQSFLSRYPNLNGITVRVATYGADTGTGQAAVKAGSAVDVLALPIDGKVVATVAGGSTVTVEGAAEGWAHVKLSNGLDGYIALEQFAQLPPASRTNTHDVTLTLYREPDMAVIRQGTINAATMHDNSHVTFSFDPIAGSNGQRYRFVLTSPDSTPGNAVTFRVDPASTYSDGQRFDDSRSVAGAIVFRPDFVSVQPIYQGNIDDFEWSSLSDAFIGSFAPKTQTADRFLSVDLVPGTRTLNVEWSLIRPSGGQPIVVDGNNQAPGGGLVFNVRYRDSISVTGVLGDAARTVWRDARNDPPFFGLYLLVIVGMLTAGGWAGLQRWLDGR